MSLIHYRQRFLGFAHFRRIRYDVDITLRKDHCDRVRLFARKNRYAANGGKESLPFEGDPFFRLKRNHLAIIGVIPFDQLGNEQGSVQLKCNLILADAEFHFTFLTHQTLNFSDCLSRNNDFCFLVRGNSTSRSINVRRRPSVATIVSLLSLNENRMPFSTYRVSSVEIA